MREPFSQSEKPLIDQVKYLHKDLTLAGEPKNSILNISDELLLYLVLLLRDDIPEKPSCSDHDWFELIDALSAHGIIPLLYFKAGRLPPELKPPEKVLAKMRINFLESRTASLQMEQQLAEITAVFDKEGLEFIVLKGPSLAWSAFPDSSLRPSGDIDILVRPRDFVKGRQILHAIGYESLDNRFETQRYFDYEEVLVNKRKNRHSCQVELHWDLLRYPVLTSDEHLDDLFNRAVNNKHDFCSFKTLHPVDTFIYLSLHLFAKHNRSIRFIWIYDLYLIAGRCLSDDDWKALQQRCTEWNAVNAVICGLKMAAVWNGLSIPAAYDDMSSWPEPSEYEEDLWRLVNSQHKSIRSIFKLTRYDSLACFAKIRCLLHIVFPSPEIIRHNFPPIYKWLIFFSYIKRWWSWTGIAFKKGNRKV